MVRWHGDPWLHVPLPWILVLCVPLTQTLEQKATLPQSQKSNDATTTDNKWHDCDVHTSSVVVLVSHLCVAQGE